MIHVTLLAVSLAATASLEPENAWAEWSRWEDFLDRLERGSLESAQKLAVDSRIQPAELAQARDMKDSLDRAVEKLRRGLKMPACSLPKEEPVRVVRLAEAATARALIAAEDGEDFSPIVLDLLAVGRRVGKCPGALLGLFVATKLERLARTLAEWGANFGLLNDAARERITAAMSVNSLGRADLDRALVEEEKEARAFLRASIVRAEHFFSRRETELLIEEKFRSLRKTFAASEPNVAALEADLRSLMNDDEKSALRELEELVSTGITTQKIEALYLLKDDREGFQRELQGLEKSLPKSRIEALMKWRIAKNAMGRAVVQTTMRQAISLAKELAIELKPGPSFQLPARARSSEWIAPGPRPAAAPKIRCVKRSKTRFEVDATTWNALEADRWQAVGSAARIVPAFNDGVVSGMKVFGFDETSWLASCGFEPGDVVHSINGTRLDAPETVIGVVASLKQTRKAEFVIDRKGRKMNVSIAASR